LPLERISAKVILVGRTASGTIPMIALNGPGPKPLYVSASRFQVRLTSALAAEAEYLCRLDCTFHREPRRHRSHILPKAAGDGFRIPTLYHHSENTECLVSLHAIFA
jgi:hypothetical protein